MGEKKNSPRREAASIPPRSQNREKGKRRRDVLLEFYVLPSFWIPQEAAGWGQCPRAVPGLLSKMLPSHPQGQLPRPGCRRKEPATWVKGGGRSPLGTETGSNSRLSLSPTEAEGFLGH